MKLRELFESGQVELLLESYRDFRKEWSNLLELSDSFNRRTLLRRYPDIARVFNVRTYGEISDVIEKILKNNQTKELARRHAELPFYTGRAVRFDSGDSGDVMTWIKSIRSFTNGNGSIVDTAVFSTLSAVNKIAVALTKIESSKPKYDKVASTASYTIFKVNNFEAAKKLRNMVRSTWCIGAQETHFLYYGEESGRDTYIVFLNRAKKGLAIHVDPSNPNNNLVTSHCNSSEARVSKGLLDYSRGSGTIEKDLLEAMTKDEIVRLFKEVGITFRFSLDTVELDESSLSRFQMNINGKLNRILEIEEDEDLNLSLYDYYRVFRQKKFKEIVKNIRLVEMDLEVGSTYYKEPEIVSLFISIYHTFMKHLIEISESESFFFMYEDPRLTQFASYLEKLNRLNGTLTEAHTSNIKAFSKNFQKMMRGV